MDGDFSGMLNIFTVDDFSDIPEQGGETSDMVAVGVRDEDMLQFGQGETFEPGGAGAAVSGVKGVILIVDFKYAAGVLTCRHGFSSGTCSDGVDSHKNFSL